MSGFFLQGGYLPTLGVTAPALTLDTRFLAQGRIRAYQGHSTDCGHDLDHMCPRYSEAALRSLEREFQSPVPQERQRWRCSRWRAGRHVTGSPGPRPSNGKIPARVPGRVHRPHPGVDSHLGERGRPLLSRSPGGRAYGDRCSPADPSGVGPGGRVAALFASDSAAAPGPA